MDFLKKIFIWLYNYIFKKGPNKDNRIFKALYDEELRQQMLREYNREKKRQYLYIIIVAIVFGFDLHYDFFQVWVFYLIYLVAIACRFRIINHHIDLLQEMPDKAE